MTRPFVSVVIPARNEERTIVACLDAVLSQDWPSDRMEIIVADGMSDDSTRRIVDERSCRDARVRLIDNPGRIVPGGMNLAIGAARGEFIVRVDGHTIIANDYVRVTIETLQRTGAEGAGGRMTPIVSPGFAGAVAFATSSPFGVGNSLFHYAQEETESDSVYLGAYPKTTFERFGGYDEAMVRNQDDELNYRIRARGGRIVLNPAIRSAYQPRGSVGRLFSQYFQYGWWKSRVMARIPASASPRHFIPSLFVLSLAGLLATSLFIPAAALLVAAILLLHAGASLAGAIFWSVPVDSDLNAQDWLRTVILVPVAALVLHTGYGLGLIAGLPSLVRTNTGERR